MAQRSPRVLTGTLFRFDSVPEILAFSRERYPTANVSTSNLDGEFVLQVRNSRGVDFESLIVHFDGEQTYAAMFPVAEKPSLIGRLRQRLRKSS